MSDRFVGRVVKITRFILHRDNEIDVAQHQPVWAVVRSASGYGCEGEIDINVFWCDPNMLGLVGLDGADHHFILVPVEDEWEFVRERAVPDEVWAALAKWRLSQ